MPLNWYIEGKPEPLDGRASLFEGRKLWAVSFRWNGEDYTFLGGLEFVTDFSNAVFEARRALELEDGPYVGLPGKGDFRAHDRSIGKLSLSARVGFGTRRRELLENKLWNMAGFALPSNAELRARAA